MNARSQIILRLGSHAEKEYVIKLFDFLNGLIVGANLFEATPAATASLLLKAGAKKVPLFLDPMTYAFGAYIDPQTREEKSDLDWIKSDQIIKKNHKKIVIRDYKKSYRKLAEAIGSPLKDALDRNYAVSDADFTTSDDMNRFCESALGYQRFRIYNEFAQDDELQSFAGDAPRPNVIFAPYFYIVPSQTEKWLDLNLKLIQTSGLIGLDADVHAVICADQEHLRHPDVLERLSSEIPKTKVKGVWLWFSKFEEQNATVEMLQNYITLIQNFSKHMLVYSMHGGFLSLALSKAGLTGVSHGIGYGEQKDVVPVIGQSTPTVRYYLPDLAKRLGVPDIERCFDALDIRTPDDFHSKVCNCVVCKGVISESVDHFAKFGERQYSTDESKRRAQTPAAAKRCRFHYLLNRFGERDKIGDMTIAEIETKLDMALTTWCEQPSLRDSSTHIARWIRVLRDLI